MTDECLEWASKITGIAEADLREACAAVEQLVLPHITRELACGLSVDAVVGSWMLATSRDNLRALGVRDESVVRKLRDDREVWPTWAEIVAAPRIARAFHATALEMEPYRSGGAHPDFALETPNGRVHVEFKALGLSDEEAAFSDRMAEGLQEVCPPEGIATFTAHPEAPGIALPPAVRASLAQDARMRLRAAFPPSLWGLSAAVATMDGGEGVYAARIRDVLEGAFRQIGDLEHSWIALHWTGGGSAVATSIALSEMTVPPNLDGVILVGAGVLLGDPRLHHFVSLMPSQGDPSGRLLETVEVRSDNPEDTQRVLGAFEQSRRVRACVVRAPSGGPGCGPRLIERLGSRIHPFNLLMSTDPDEAVLADLE